MNKNEIDLAKEIVKKHFSDESFMAQIDMAYALVPYIENLVKLDGSQESYMVQETMLHDYKGLKSGDKFFLPRLS